MATLVPGSHVSPILKSTSAEVELIPLKVVSELIPAAGDNETGTSGVFRSQLNE